jgi:hypothetical protein
MVNDGGFKKPMGFKGFVVTDYRIPEMIAHGMEIYKQYLHGTKRWN